MDRKQALARLREAVKNHPSKTEFAHVAGVSPQYICDILAGRKEMGPTVLKALGLRKIVSVTYDERGGK